MWTLAIGTYTYVCICYRNIYIYIYTYIHSVYTCDTYIYICIFKDIYRYFVYIYISVYLRMYACSTKIRNIRRHGTVWFGVPCSSWIWLWPSCTLSKDLRLSKDFKQLFIAKGPQQHEAITMEGQGWLGYANIMQFGLHV